MGDFASERYFFSRETRFDMEGQIEFGKFDLNRIPLDWSKVTEKKKGKLNRALENSVEQQINQLKKRHKELNDYKLQNGTLPTTFVNGPLENPLDTDIAHTDVPPPPVDGGSKRRRRAGGESRTDSGDTLDF
jgi:hypothetical protein